MGWIKSLKIYGFKVLMELAVLALHTERAIFLI